MSFYEGSQLTVEWTNQHGCGSNPKLVCNLVIQYMCGTTSDDPLVRIRDGVTTNTIPATAEGAEAVEANNQSLTYGMHESLQSYQNCETRSRNMGLYIADRATQGGLTTARTTSIYTRQNNNGAQNGLECPEERDYYPYWHPSQWKDIAVLTTNTGYCKFYQTNSENVMAKGFCQDPNNPGPQVAPNNPTDCVNANYQWQMQAAFGLKAPDCVVVPWSRENHLGNGVVNPGFNNNYNMTIPQSESCADTNNCVCVLRLRYNISSVEDAYPQMSDPQTGFVDYHQNGVNNSAITENPVLTRYGSELILAVDTTQFGRTFQDRSHTFSIVKRPSGVLNSARIYNLNVRGKRGNIVQTYPATEYDFIPSYLYTRVGDYIHFQWTGCDTNPAGNAGEGIDGTDRSNWVQVTHPSSNVPATDSWIAANPKKTFWGDVPTRLRFAWIDQTNCLPYTQVLANNGGNAGNADEDPQNCAKLNAPGANYFNGGLHKMNKTGTFNYMSTRAHEFTNRDQKGIIYVVPLLPGWAVGLIVTGSVLFGGACVMAGLMYYAKSHPHSGVANLFSKM
jgi:hypothetical protein